MTYSTTGGGGQEQVCRIPSTKRLPELQRLFSLDVVWARQSQTNIPISQGRPIEGSERSEHSPTTITCEIHHHPLHSLMSHPNPTTATSSSPNFQLIFNNALKSYEKRTKSDLLAHPLVVQLQDCNSLAAILAVVHQQVQQFHQSRGGDETLTKWLDPTVKILYALSETLGEGVSLVCPRE